ncbi:stage V sporulation protein AD [Pseudalkalibacillus caeni]|uniref:Stage V sporulation protein AD n=1 Tax=Exobacillus caeni TaxID=2574798 RepID=A0A5R9F597_9BACL|nr:stage V sporulation protein AD [Pseudalkalibacillus caeni]TLS35654.1 stage V sporulation protein AD [Pseudalkalibacillus caeni]
MPKIGTQTWSFSNVFLQSTGTAVGPDEANGPLSSTFDKVYDELHCGEENWELAERKLMEDAIDFCLKKGAMQPYGVDFFLAGDLLNQIVTANYVARGNKIPFLGLFGACSTSMESVALGASLIEGGFADNILAAVSSHNATAERQFRYPTEYGGQKPGTATYTVTGAGAALLGRQSSGIQITASTIGKVFDWGIKDPFDMGSAMAPAAADTISAHFKDTNSSPDDFDLIVTGDLSAVGSPIVKDMLLEKGYDVRDVHNDCGLMIFNSDQPVFSGGSGCACSAVVTYGHLMEELIKGNLNKIFVVATGALLSPVMIQQKESIPTIAHGVVFESTGGKM